MNVNEIRDLEGLEPLPKPTDPDDYDGADFTPLQIMVAAARGLKEELGSGAEGGAETNPQMNAPPAGPALTPMKAAAPVPAAVNGSSNGNGNGRSGG